jgi:hypothetical protein
MGHHENCCKGHCKPKHWANTGDMMTDYLLELSDKAWEQVMLEKMKKAYEKHRGQEMDKMAEGAVKTALTYWLNKMKSQGELQKAYSDLKHNLG